jgi:hypothetical protein
MFVWFAAVLAGRNQTAGSMGGGLAVARPVGVGHSLAYAELIKKVGKNLLVL